MCIVGKILAIDIVYKWRKRRKLIRKARKNVDYVKLGLPFLLNTKPKIIKKISKKIPVIIDFKIADIPDIAGIIAKRCFDLGASAIICHSFCGFEMINRCIECGDVFVVVEMTSDTIYTYKTIPSSIFLKMLNSTDIKGVVVPGNKPKHIPYYREIFKDKLLISPGIGTQGGSEDIDVDYLIIGRSLISKWI